MVSNVRFLQYELHTLNYHIQRSAQENSEVSIPFEGATQTVGDTSFWIGLKDLGNDDWKNSDGSDAIFLNWFPGGALPPQPDNLGATFMDPADCAAHDINNLSWFDFDCGDEKPFVCEFL